MNTLIQNASSGDTILLERDYLFNSTVDANYSMGIVIDKALTIDGQAIQLMQIVLPEYSM